MEPYQQRVVDEHAQLTERYTKLRDFESTEQFGKLPRIHQQLLIRQANAMLEYKRVLEERLVLFACA